MAGTEMKLSVESFTIHEAIRKFIQKIWDEHGIQIDSINTRWIDVDTVLAPNKLLRELHILTISHEGKKDA